MRSRTRATRTCVASRMAPRAQCAKSPPLHEQASGNDALCVNFIFQLRKPMARLFTFRSVECNVVR
ncbi:hypothetical protein LMG29542_04555 [Paraburkholderia humisilvae]|uniref:Uncharacterized protein n=1 Tax=Paraburkholderia humisilvae TaxID=627669 RepID=A0A6J5ECD2_9BURK|nr:hypothetical protein LMG29542_04555 [Paraburkholderia humisilvae]